MSSDFCLAGKPHSLRSQVASPGNRISHKPSPDKPAVSHHHAQGILELHRLESVQPLLKHCQGSICRATLLTTLLIAVVATVVVTITVPQAADAVSILT